MPADDLDALLDEAMEIVDEQERRNEEDAKIKEAKLEADLQKAMEEIGGGSEQDMMKAFQSMFGAMGNEEMNDDFFEKFKKDVGDLVSSLEGATDLADGDRANLDRVKQLMSVMENEDVDKANELLEKMKAEGDFPTDPADADADMTTAVQRCMEAMQNVESASAGAPPVPSAPATAEGDMAPIPENVASMLLSTLLDPQFVEPIKVMRDAYGPWMAAHATDVSESEMVRFTQQHQKAKEICTFLEVPLQGPDDERIARLLDLMHEYSELGEPPGDLATFAPKHADQKEA